MAATNALARSIGEAAGTVARRLIDSPGSPLDAASPGRAQAELERAVAREVAPLVEHATNTEPWYLSRVTWGAVVAGVSPLLGLVLGAAPTLEEQSRLAEIGAAAGTILGAGLALYGRWLARRPIGT